MENIIENTLVIGALVLLVIIPIMIISRREKLKKNIKINALITSVANEQMLACSKTGVLEYLALGLDSTKKKLMVITIADETFSVLDLNKFTKSNVLKTETSVSVQSIDLLLTGKSGNQDHHISFYREHRDNEMKIKQLEQICRDWSSDINKVLGT